MFKKLFKNYSWQEDYLKKQFDTDIDLVLNGDYRYISSIFGIFPKGNKSMSLKAAKTLRICLDRFTSDEIIKTDSMMRDSTSMEWYNNWGKINLADFLQKEMSNEEQRAILIFASFHPNGFIRERAVKMLSQYSGTLLYLVLRTNDWVAQVRQANKEAIKYKMEHLAEGELMAALPFFEKINLGKRSRQDYDTKEFYNKLLEPAYRGELAQGLSSENPFIRKLCMDVLLSVEPFDTEVLKYLEKEKIPFVRFITLKKLIQRNFDKKETVIEKMLVDKYSKIRGLALEYLFTQDTNILFETVINMLLDESAGIRDFARYIILKKQPDFDIRKFYLDSIDNPENDKARISAIYGIGEVGIKDDAKAIDHYLDCGSPSRVKAAIYTCSKLCIEKYRLNIINKISDNQPGVSKGAYKLVKEYVLDYEEIYELYCEVHYEHSRKRYASILMDAPKWQRLIYILRLLPDKNEMIVQIAQLNLNRWIWNFSKSYTAPTKEQISKITTLIEVSEQYITENVWAELEFVLNMYFPD